MCRKAARCHCQCSPCFRIASHLPAIPDLSVKTSPAVTQSRGGWPQFNSVLARPRLSHAGFPMTLPPWQPKLRLPAWLEAPPTPFPWQLSNPAAPLPEKLCGAPAYSGFAPRTPLHGVRVSVIP
eukprot:EG_transcript_29676